MLAASVLHAANCQSSHAILARFKRNSNFSQITNLLGYISQSRWYGHVFFLTNLMSALNRKKYWTSLQMLFLQRPELLPKSQEYFSSANRINSFESLTIARKVLSIQIYGFLPHLPVYLLLYESCLFVIFIWYNTLNWYWPGLFYISWARIWTDRSLSTSSPTSGDYYYRTRVWSLGMLVTN